MSNKHTLEQLVLNYHGYVFSLAAKIGAGHNEEYRKELISIGNLALCEAANKCDLSYGGFSTYAYRCIEGTMLNYVNGHKRHKRSSYDEEENDLQREDSQNLYIMQGRNLESWKQVDHLLANSQLTKQEYDVIRWRYGIDCPALSTQEIADYYHRTVQQINNIKRAGFAKMRIAA